MPWCELLNTSYENIIGKNWFSNFIPKTERNNISVVFNQLMSGELELFHTHQNDILTAQGKNICVSWDNSLIKRRSDQKILGCFSLGKKAMQCDCTSLEHNLTQRELEILTFLAQGFAPKEISHKLEIQPKTVHAHKINLFNKMNFNSNRELVSFAIKNRLLKIEDLVFD